jgi:hypothetical protein
VLWRECFLLCMHLVRISVLWFKHVRLSASRINNFSVMQVSQNLAPGKYIPVFALTFHCISGWIFLSFRLQTCFESLVGFLSAVFLFLSAPRCSVYRFLKVLPVIPMYCMVLFGSITSAWYTNGPIPVTVQRAWIFSARTGFLRRSRFLIQHFMVMFHQMP